MAVAGATNYVVFLADEKMILIVDVERFLQWVADFRRAAGSVEVDLQRPIGVFVDGVCPARKDVLTKGPVIEAQIPDVGWSGK